MKLNKRELATAIAALRYWQRKGLISCDHEIDIATDEGTLKIMQPREIDDLCRRLNNDKERDINDEMLEALKDLIGGQDSLDDDGNGHCLHCGRELDEGMKLCDSDDCPGFRARAVITKTKALKSKLVRKGSPLKPSLAQSKPAPKLAAKDRNINSEILEALKLAIPELEAWSNSKSFRDVHGDPDQDYSKALMVATATIAKAETFGRLRLRKSPKRAK